MDSIEALQRYRRYLDSIEEQSPQPCDDEEYFELLAPGEAIDLLCARDELAGAQLTAAQRQEVRRLDGLLRKHAGLVSGNVLPPPDKPRRFWWWFLAATAAEVG